MIFENEGKKLELVQEEEKLYDDEGKLKVNQEWKALIPRPAPDEREKIKESLQKNGQKYPVEVDQKTMDIVDGYTRYELLKELGMRIWYKLKYFKDKADMLNFVLISNVHRRHLRPFDKVKLFRPLYDKEVEEAKQRLKEISSHKIPVEKKGSAMNKFSEKVGVSPVTARNSIIILEKGSKKQQSLVEKGTISITQMVKTIQRKTSMDERLHYYKVTIRDRKGKVKASIEKKLTNQKFLNMESYIRNL